MRIGIMARCYDEKGGIEWAMLSIAIKELVEQIGRAIGEDVKFTDVRCGPQRWCANFGGNRSRRIRRCSGDASTGLSRTVRSRSMLRGETSVTTRVSRWINA
jgi:hypothetical protein